ncbi:MAG: protein-methionine-sulfoxide reductase heme-binding subunit MsrQ [Anaerolineales bacterium]|jgi:sulfoxide reductase heme-binding subunit YedZ|nr:protein-methionine-sulfoxide reductase heme-binding subunit MsrQ [Anaerolineales bacterium]
MKKPRFTPLQILVHFAGWLPLALLIVDFLRDNLTANPIQAIEQRSGLNAVTFLLLSLACTPIAAIFGWKELIQRRKALGNYGFLYAATHVSTFFILDYGLDLSAIWRDVGTKSFIIIGAIAFLLLLPLAITSFNYFMKRLGKNWKRLHRLVYIISPLVIVHFFMAKKGSFLTLSGDILQPLAYGAVALILLLLRVTPIKKTLMALRKKYLPPR